MFTDLFIQTTNPELSFQEVFTFSILAQIVQSTLFHTILYCLFLNLVFFIFTGKFLSATVNTRLILCLVIIMFFGFFARYFHVKEIYKAYHYDLEKTRNHLDKLYIGWIFLS